MEFKKPAISSEDHFDLLISRGLKIDDKEQFLKYLNNIGYYRICGYMYPFQSDTGDHTFKQSTSFDQIINHYIFDKKLRLIILDYIERIEVAFRSKLCNLLALKHGAHWYLDSGLFNDKSSHSELIDFIRKNNTEANEQFIKNYLSKYTKPSDPPVWMVFETLSFGKLSNIYSNLIDNDEKKAIAHSLGTQVPILESWLKSINLIRNISAHHSRLWNRKLPIKPIIPRRKSNKFLSNIDEDTDKRLYGILSCMLYISKKLSNKPSLCTKLLNLFEEYPEINISYMGFPENFREEELWSFYLD